MFTDRNLSRRVNNILSFSSFPSFLFLSIHSYFPKYSLSLLLSVLAWEGSKGAPKAKIVSIIVCFKSSWFLIQNFQVYTLLCSLPESQVRITMLLVWVKYNRHDDYSSQTNNFLAATDEFDVSCTAHFPRVCVWLGCRIRSFVHTNQYIPLSLIIRK